MPKKIKKQESVDNNTTPKLNPDIVKFEIGVRNLREVTIYPLSMADQFKATDIIVSAFQGIAGNSDLDSMQDSDAVEAIVNIIKDNLEKIIKLITAEDESVTMEELTNNQFSDLVTLVYNTNYDGMIKNFHALYVKVKSVLPSKK